MDKSLVVAVRWLACVLTLAALSACGGGGGAEETSSGVNNPPAAEGPGNDEPPVTDEPGDSEPTPEPTPDPNPTPGNVSPSIAGSPGTEVIVGQAYNFTPNATDVDGDNLTFSISSKPSWASFNAGTGQLSGTPTAGDVGTHEEITITVTDGHGTDNLAQFAINVVQQSNGSVTLAWQAPTENTDGSPLVNLNGYKIHYGTQSGQYSATVTLNNSSLTRYVVENLTPGTYYFAVTALTANGVESDLSGEASKTI